MDIRSLVKKAGGPAKVGAILGITSQAVSQWHRVPPEHCIPLERATSGALSRHDLRPDIFGPAPEGERVRESGE